MSSWFLRISWADKFLKPTTKFGHSKQFGTFYGISAWIVFRLLKQTSGVEEKGLHTTCGMCVWNRLQKQVGRYECRSGISDGIVPVYVCRVHVNLSLSVWIEPGYSQSYAFKMSVFLNSLLCRYLPWKLGLWVHEWNVSLHHFQWLWAVVG